MTDHTRKYWISTHDGIPKQTRKILNEYLLSLKLAIKAEATISKYRSYIERFCSECLVELDSLTYEDVLKWVNKFSEGKKYSTVVNVLSILTTFFNFCIGEDYMDKEVMKMRCVPKLSQSLPRFLTDREYYRVILSVEPKSLGSRAIVQFHYPRSSHLSEAVNLLIKNLDEMQRTAEVSVKASKNTVYRVHN